MNAYLDGFEIHEAEKLYAYNLADVWDQIDSGILDLLAIKVNNILKITARQQFENIYKNFRLAAWNIEEAKVNFYMAWDSAAFELQKIINKNKVLQGLGDFSNWCIKETSANINTNSNTTTTDSISTVKTNDTNKNYSIDDSTGTINLKNNKEIRGGVSDGNSSSDDNLLKIGEKSINANTLNQSLEASNDKTSTTNYIERKNNTSSENINNSTSEGTVLGKASSLNFFEKTVSNSSEDFIKYLGLNIADVRKQFWSKFRCLFVVDFTDNYNDQ